MEHLYGVAIKSIVFLVTIRLVASDLFSSTDHVAGMFMFEKRLLEQMEQFVSVSRKRLDVFTKLPSEIDNIWQKTWNSSKEVRGGGNNAQWNQLEAVVQWDPFKDVIKDMWHQWRTYIPDDETLLGVHSTLLRLIEVYELNINKLAESGKIGNQSAVGPLTAEDFRNLAITSINEGKFDLASELTKAVIDINKDPPIMREMMRFRSIIAYARHALNGDDDEEEFSGSDEDDDLSWETMISDLRMSLTWKLNNTENQNLKSVHTILTYDPEEGFSFPEEPKLGRNIYYELCRGNTRRQFPNLFCEVRYGRLPYYFWWNVEHFHMEPRITLIYNIISDAESERLKVAVKPSLQRAAVISPYSGEYTISKNRLGRHSWLDNAQADSLVKNLANKLTEVTGLDCKQWAEDLQISVYGIGGLYTPHYDYDRQYFKNMESDGVKMGDRLATLMIYLSDVPAGGATVFPVLGVAAFPVKNAALFWYNLRNDGEDSPESLHGGCPVLLGHKWVANKWIHEYGQEFNYPCRRVEDNSPAVTLQDVLV